MKWKEESYIGDRYEFKYILSKTDAQRVQNYIEKVGLIRDSNSKDSSYTVNSLYFETPFLDDYRDKDASLLVRKKMRARMYDESWYEPHKNVWIEIKGKKNFHIKKRRARISGDSWEKFANHNSPLLLIGNEDDEKAKSTLEKFSYLYEKGRYNPHVIIKYQREAFLDLFTNNIRVTFDSDIKSCFAKGEKEERFMTDIFPDKTIMEIKFIDKLPWWFTRMTDVFDMRRSDFSKYNHSVATLKFSYRIPISR